MEIEEIRSLTFEKTIVNANKPVVIYVYSMSCPNCKTLAHNLKETQVTDESLYVFRGLDARENIDVVKKYKVLVVPTLLFFVHGILVDKKAGVIAQEKIEKRLLPLNSYSVEEAKKKEVTGYFKMPWS